MSENPGQVDIEVLSGSPGTFRAVRLDAVFSRSMRRNILLGLGALCFLLAISYGVAFMGGSEQASKIAKGLFFIFFGPLWGALLFEFYFLETSRSVPFLRARTKEGEQVFYVDMGAARRLVHLGILERVESDISGLYDFFSVGEFMPWVMVRLGLSGEDSELSQLRGEMRVPRDLFLKTLVWEAYQAGSDTITAREFALLLFDLDENFEKFLFEREIRREEFEGAAHWVQSLLTRKQSRERWWERAVLGRAPGIGADLIFGYSPRLDRFSHDIRPGLQGSIVPAGAVHAKEVIQIEEVLARTGETNALLVGEPGSGKSAILEQIARAIGEGKAPSVLLSKRLVSLDVSAITASTKEKGLLEELLIQVMNEAISAGNIVLVMDNFPVFIESTQALGTNVMALLEPYLESSGLQVIALSTPDEYNRILQPNPTAIKLFEKVEVEEPKKEDTVFVLEEVAFDLERKSSVIITYQALKAASELADRYISDGAMPEKAIDLLERGAAVAERAGSLFVLKNHIEHAVEARTHIPVGGANSEEAQKLLNLEEELSKRIVGQKQAVHAVAEALRRTRAGLHGSKRPVGSFLFLGPTGVGKTETAKALASVYFGSSEAMIRFDMSEFQGPEGVNKLIGSFDRHEPGVLASALRARPFSLLLFDEFEKSSREVINLFLQILEEGFFTDAVGKKVSVRDAIIITTSNAGSSTIWDLVQQGKDLSVLEKDIIEVIRKEGVFAPEILNRFDAMVVYKPLSREELYQVAKLLLEELAMRLKGQDIELIITEDLVVRVVELGYDPVMGARPMRRAIANHVEGVIAQKLLRGEVRRGENIEFTSEEVRAL